MNKWEAKASTNILGIVKASAEAEGSKDTKSEDQKLEDFEAFHPDRMASRILGMGDVLTLIEKAEESYDLEVAAKAEAKLRKGQMTLEDFLDQMQQVKKMGPLQNLIGLMPGMPKEIRQAQIDDSAIARIEAIIRSMTPVERADPDIIDGSRRQRIARGSGTTVQEVSRLLNARKEMQKLMKRMGQGKMPMLPPQMTKVGRR